MKPPPAAHPRPPAAPPPPPTSTLEWIAACAVAAAAILCYLPTVGNGYVLDDVLTVQHNPTVLEGRIGAALTQPYWPPQDGAQVGAANWRPLATASLALERRLTGTDAVRLHHAVNAILHGLSALLLFLVARRLVGSGWPAILACACYVAHPSHTEAVALVVGRTDCLAALGAVGTLAAFWRYRDGGPRAAGWLAAATLAYAVGCGGKESAVPILAALPLADLLLRRVPFGVLIGRPSLAYLPLLAVAVLWFGGRIAVLGDHAFAHGGDPSTLLERIRATPRNVVVATSLLVAPLRFHHILTTLPSDAPFTYPTPGWLAALGWWVASLPILAGWVCCCRRAPVVAFCWIAAILPWLPSSGLLPTAAGTSLRFLLLPSAFAACLLVRGLHGVRPGARPVALAATGAAILAGCAITMSRLPALRDNGTFYRALLREVPGCYTARYGLGSFLAQQQPPDYAGAREQLEAALAITGETARGHAAMMNLAILAEHAPDGTRRGVGARLDEAIAWYRRALAVHETWDASLNLAIDLEHLGRTREAAPYFAAAALLNPAHPQVALLHLKAGMGYAELGNRLRARTHLQEFLARDPQHPDVPRVRDALARLGG